MATATATATLSGIPAGSGLPDFSGKSFDVYGTIAVQASPATYVTGGLPITFANLDFLKSGVAPVWTEAGSAPAPGVSPSGFQYYVLMSVVNGVLTGKLAIFTGAAAQSALTELTNAAAIPAGVSGDVISFHAVFPRQ